MPCYDSREDVARGTSQDLKESQDYIDKLTRMLCEAMSCEAMQEYLGASYELRQWWVEHQKVDKKRKKRGKC